MKGFSRYEPNKPIEYYEEQYHVMESLKAEAIASLAQANASLNAADMFEWAVDKYQDVLCVESVDLPTTYTFRQLDEAANRIAHWALSQGLVVKDTVALMMENRPEYLAWTMGLAKAGVTIALINTNLQGALLGHALATAKPKLAVISTSFKDVWVKSKSDLEESLSSISSSLPVVHWYAGQDIDVVAQEGVPSAQQGNFHYLHINRDTLSHFPTSRIPSSHRASIDTRHPLFYIYTSGTTGPSKAAKFSHKRFIGAAVTWAAPSGLESGEKYYISLPLFHGNAGVVAVAPCYLLGCPMVLRKKFSVTHFLSDIRKHDCKGMIYIGELWRYLYTASTTLPNNDFSSPLRVIIGNGLREELWEVIKERFGIEHVVEHYGSTEMPGDAILNYFNKPGSCGFLPLAVNKAKSMTGQGGVLVQYDVEADEVVRDDKGRCLMCQPGSVGEMIMRLPGGLYDGYVGDEQTRRKLYTDVFEVGDTWWSSGDLLKMDERGFFYFVDRTGDTFRWKGENVSTKEVEAVIGKLDSVAEVNVYGVKIPHAEGRCGMASITLKNGHSMEWEGLTSALASQLPNYARPLFVRVRQTENEKTSTLKFQKFKYAKDGFDPSRMNHDEVYVYWNASKSWIQVTSSVFDSIQKDGLR